MRASIESQLAGVLDKTLVHELLEAHSESKRNYYLGHLRPAEVEGGRFCEAAFRILQFVTKSGTYTPLNRSLPSTDTLMGELANLDSSKFNDSIRLHIPRSLRLVYDIRNKRDAAHLADGIDPNEQDSLLVISVVDWVLAEFIRLYHKVSANEASAMVDGIVERMAPVVQDFDGFLKTLNPRLQVSDRCVVLLYQRGKLGATYEEVEGWLPPRMRTNLRRTLRTLVEDKDLVHLAAGRYRITRRGENFVEARDLIRPEQIS